MLPGCATALDKKKCVPRLELKLSFQEGIAPGKNLGEQLDFMEDLEVRGFEPNGRNLPARVNEIHNALSGRDIEVSAICAGFDGFILAEDQAVKASFDKSMREIVAAAGELGSVGVIMVPAFNGQTPCRPHTLDTRNYLCEQLHDLGEFALEHGTTVILEPLNRREAFYLRQVADAAAIARDSDSKGVKVMGDFWHMSEETSDYGALTSAGIEYLQHVHIVGQFCAKQADCEEAHEMGRGGPVLLPVLQEGVGGGRREGRLQVRIPGAPAHGLQELCQFRVRHCRRPCQDREGSRQTPVGSMV